MGGVPLREAPAEEALLYLEESIEGVLHVPRVLERLADVTGHELNRLPQLAANGRGHGLHTVPVHLLELPEDPVGRLQHALKCVPAPVLPAQGVLLLLDACACVIDHFLTLVQLPFLAYRLRPGSPRGGFG